MHWIPVLLCPEWPATSIYHFWRWCERTGKRLNPHWRTQESKNCFSGKWGKKSGLIVWTRVPFAPCRQQRLCTFYRPCIIVKWYFNIAINWRWYSFIWRVPFHQSRRLARAKGNNHHKLKYPTLYYPSSRFPETQSINLRLTEEVHIRITNTCTLFWAKAVIGNT